MNCNGMKRTGLLTVALLLASCGRPATDEAEETGAQPGADRQGGAAEVPSPAAGAEDAKGEEVTLNAADGMQVFGTFRPTDEESDRVVLFFHQARSNRHEYDPIAPQLNALGWDTLAVDQRSGGTMWDHDNETVEQRGESAEYLDALPDLQAALDWAQEKDYDKAVAVGSSYSAALVFLLAEQNPGKLTAVAAFSPGEYLGKEDLVKNAAAAIDIPVYVTAGSGAEEQARIDEVLSKTDSEKVVRRRPEHGVHGASTLRKDKNPQGAAENFEHFADFLKGLLSAE